MKKVLLGASVLTAVAFGAGQAHADGIKLDLAGHAKLYMDYNDQHGGSANGSDIRSVDIVRDTEIHFTGETTLDNGLTVGFHEEADVDNEFSGQAPAGAGDTFKSQESYAYFSGYWGRVNFGKEDGAAYLLQVAAPSADENYDGLRQYISPFNIASTAQGAFVLNNTVLDYAQDSTGYANKLTYLTPQFGGFQFGVSYTPDVGGDTAIGAGGLLHGGFPRGFDTSNAFGNHDSNTIGGVPANSFGSAWEGSGRWEGQWRNFGITAGGGYTHVYSESESVAPGATDLSEYNGGVNVAFGAFNVGGAYLHNSGGLAAESTGRTYVGGIDYTVGPVKFGGSWLNNHQEEGPGVGSLRTNRYTGGAVYTYGPGMTFRGSVSYLNTRSSTPGSVGVDGATGLLGTQINF